MKFKNFRSAIHNFAHSFQSVDYTKSGKLALNILIDLNNQKLNPSAKLDFINKTINPEEAISDSSKKLLNDYLDWLPEHLKNHDCDIDTLEKLEIIISADFDNASSLPKNKNFVLINVKTKTTWAATNRNEEIIEISENEAFANGFLKTGLPEF